MKKIMYFLLAVGVFAMFFVLDTVTKIEAPLIELSKMPRCENNDVVITGNLKPDIIKFADNKIKQGTGESYFSNHYYFKNLDMNLAECEFAVRYEFAYDELHSEMSVLVKVFNETNLAILDTSAFLRPVNVLLRSDEAVAIANNQSISFDYYNLVIDIPHQTFVYKFYKNLIPEGNVLVLSIDAQSTEMQKTTTQITEATPIV